MVRLGWIVMFLLPAAPAMAGASSENSSDEVALFDRLNVREQILDGQKTAAEGNTRQVALLAYRLAERRTLGFAANPENRLDDARALDLALVALRRGLDETKALGDELDRVRLERTTMENALVTRALRESASSVPARRENIRPTEREGGQPTARRACSVPYAELRLTCPARAGMDRPKSNFATTVSTCSPGSTNPYAPSRPAW